MSAQENFIKFINIDHYRVKFETSSCSSKSFEKLFFFISHVELPICSFRNGRYKHATELSKYIWSLKVRKIAYQIKWLKIKQARSYSNASKRYNLCSWKKLFILRIPEMSTLNSRNELASGCRHAGKFLLQNVLF